MTETFKSENVDQAVEKLGNFLEAERGASPDGGFASEQVAQHVMTVAERTQHLLTSVAHPQIPRMFVPLSKYNAGQYDEAVSILPGHMVLVPSPLVGSLEKSFYPAVVSEDGIAQRALRLHVLHQPYLFRGLGVSAATLLSAAGQSETLGVGDDNRPVGDGIEVEHFAALLTVGESAGATATWRTDHANHGVRKLPNSSVSSQFVHALLGQEARQSTLTITKKQIDDGKAMILWHDSLRDVAGDPEAATRDNALVTLQALGYQALTPEAVDNIKRSLE